MAFYLCGLGLLLSQTIAAALIPFPKQAGTASSIIGFSQQCGAAIMGALMGSTLSATAWPMAIGVAIAGGGALMLWLVTRRLRAGAV
jgi:DHA1 family bicyclomycin/chloramphenicol resistance-like MFS transporter